ncbi:hypothetical protein Tco_0625377 [Tanacetum coccineum]|uniref:BTB domain-containing protein n=1 Tax=Tanacetum coccineum TaxID=301880 RepID=A0ABQ4WGS3_9ASTR
MNPQKIQQVAARDEKWIPSTKRVKISSTNIRLETTLPQKKETFQVVIDIIKNSTCFKAFTISADVPEIFMQQFWYTIKKVQDTDSYEFLLANKKCIVNAKVFRTILNICPRVEGDDFIEVPNDDIALTFLIDLGYMGKDYQEYGHPILDVMLTDAIKRSESYQMFIKYSTNQIPPKKSRGKSSKGKKTAEESQETVNVSKESEPKPEPAKKNTYGKRRVKKKVTLSADDNIVSDDPDAALELAKSINQTEAKEAEAARKVHATHARIVTETVPESTKKKSSGRSSKSVVIQDTPSAPKSKPATSKTKLKGAPSLTPQEQEATDIMQALKESKKTSRRQPGTGGSNEGTGCKPGVFDESTVVSTTSSEGTGAKLGVPDEDKDITKEKVILEWGDEQDSEFSNDDNDNVEKDDKDGNIDDEGDDHVSDTHDVDDEDVKTKSDEDDIYKYEIPKEEAEKNLEAKDDAKKTELPPSSSSLSVSLGFGDQFLKLSSDSSLASTVKDSADADKIPVLVILETTNLPHIPEIVTETLVLTDVPSPQVTPIFSYVQQTPTPIPTLPITTDAPTFTTVVLESNTLSVVELRVAKLEKDMSELKTVDHSLEVLVHLPKLTKKLTTTAEQESEKSPSDILKIKREQAESQKNPWFTIKSTDKAAVCLKNIESNEKFVH